VLSVYQTDIIFYGLVLEKFPVKARDYDEYIAIMRPGRAAEVAKAAAV
jgi:hypothetical protein